MSVEVFIILALALAWALLLGVSVVFLSSATIRRNRLQSYCDIYNRNSSYTLNALLQSGAMNEEEEEAIKLLIAQRKRATVKALDGF
jgi:hypothetical protein